MCSYNIFWPVTEEKVKELINLRYYMKANKIAVRYKKEQKRIREEYYDKGLKGGPLTEALKLSSHNKYEELKQTYIETVYEIRLKYLMRIKDMSYDNEKLDDILEAINREDGASIPICSSKNDVELLSLELEMDIATKKATNARQLIISLFSGLVGALIVLTFSKHN